MTRAAAVLARVWTVGCLVLLGVLLVGVASGYRLRTVSTSSMDPAVPAGSLAVVEPAGIDEIQVGDVVAFTNRAQGSEIMHRAVEVDRDGRRVVLRTKGDANPTADTDPVEAGNLVGKLWFQVPGGGGVARWIAPPRGVGLAIAVPLLVAGLISLVRSRRCVGPDASSSSGDASVA